MRYSSDSKLLALLLQNLEEAFLLLDNELIIIAFNDKTLDLVPFILKEKPVVGKSLFLFVKDERLPHLKEVYENVLKGDAIDYELSFFTADAREVVINNSNKPLKDINGKIIGIVITSKDITETVKAQRVLENNEKKYRALFNEGTDLTGIIDEKGNYKYISPGCEKLLGFKSEACEGKNVFAFIHVDDHPAIYFALSELDIHKRVVIEPYRIMHRQGTYRWLETIATNMNDEPAVQGIVVNSRDITERKKMQDLLAANEQQLSLIYNTVADGIFMLQVEDNGQYKILSINEPVVRATGIEPDKILQKYVHEVVPEASLQYTLTKVRETIEKNAVNTWEETTQWPAGKKTFITTLTPILNTNGSCTYLIGSIHDITSQRDKQRQLLLLESVVMNTTDSIMITNTVVQHPGPNIIYVNHAFTRLTGYEQDEVLEKTPRMLQGEKTDQQELKRLSECLSEFKPCEIEVINYKKNGEEFWSNISVFPIGEKDSYTYFIAFQRDITERKKNEIEKEQLLLELTRTNRELKELNYITSHNLRGPLTNLLSIAELIEIEQIHDKDTITLINGFKTSTYQLDQTLNDLLKILAFKKPADQQLEDVFFQQAFSETMASLSFIVEESGIRITTDFLQVEKVPFNHVYMQSIFLNLITNAIKYRHPDRTPLLTIYSMKPGKKVQLVFEDNGMGFDHEKVKDRVFGLYQRFHTHKEGQGLGLYLIRSQINATGGDIAIESAVDKGTKLTITFR